MDNKELYNQDREKRWGMAKEKEPEAIEAIRNKLRDILGECVEYSRYDEFWFKKYDPSEPENEWVRGASDYVIRIAGVQYIYAEIKIKSVKFKKTLYGGVTQKGSSVANYGCESFYLDIEPVFKNMCLFTQEVHIDSDNFLIFFVNEEITEVNVISLKEIQDLVNFGYNGQPLCIFSEGYGIDTKNGVALNYLIPVNCTHELDKNIADYIIWHCSQRLVKEKKN